MGTESKNTGVYEFGPFRLDVAMRRLEKGGSTVTLTATLFELLLLLVSRRGELVTKEELITRVWGGRAVEENNLTVSVSALRKALGEKGGGRREYIETVPKYGYRFVARVRAVGGAGDAHVAAEARDATSIRSLAVLPLLNAAGDPELDYFADGVTEGIINRLSEVPQLRVMARSTVFRYKGAVANPREAGVSLGVRAVLVGELRRSGEVIEVAAELVDVLDGSQIWGGHYRRGLSDTYAFQEDIAREISEKLFLKLSPGESRRLSRSDTDNWEAYHLYLKGRYLWDRRVGQYRKAMRYFEAAIALDKFYALAYVGLADCHNELVLWEEIPPSAGYPVAKELILKALEIDDSLAEAHVSLAVVKEFFDWDFGGADVEFRQAISLNPSSAITRRRYSTYLTHVGKWREALEQMRLSQMTDPLPGLINAKLGRIFYYARQYERALEFCREAPEVNQPPFDAYIISSLALVGLGRADEALEAALKARDLAPYNTEILANLGYVYGAAGEKNRALEVLANLHEISRHRYIPPHMMAVPCAGLGDADETIDWLERAYDAKSFYMAALGALPIFDGLRADARFISLLKRIGHPVRPGEPSRPE